MKRSFDQVYDALMDRDPSFNWIWLFSSWYRKECLERLHNELAGYSGRGWDFYGPPFRMTVGDFLDYCSGQNLREKYTASAAQRLFDRLGELECLDEYLDEHDAARAVVEIEGMLRDMVLEATDFLISFVAREILKDINQRKASEAGATKRREIGAQTRERVLTEKRISISKRHRRRLKKPT
jgi:hypothetical protein